MLISITIMLISIMVMLISITAGHEHQHELFVIGSWSPRVRFVVVAVMCRAFDRKLASYFRGSVICFVVQTDPLLREYLTTAAAMAAAACYECRSQKKLRC